MRAEQLWALFGPEMYLKLVVDAGMTREVYEQTLFDAVLRLTASPPPPTAPRKRTR